MATERRPIHSGAQGGGCLAATFELAAFYNIGAITLFIAPTPWDTFTSAATSITFTGDATLTPSISLELQGTSQGQVWSLTETRPGEWSTTIDGYRRCFSAGCPSVMDAINVRLQALPSFSDDTITQPTATLRVCGITLQ